MERYHSEWECSLNYVQHNVKEEIKIIPSFGKMMGNCSVENYDTEFEKELHVKIDFKQ